jgi:HSP20 family protein
MANRSDAGGAGGRAKGGQQEQAGAGGGAQTGAGAQSPGGAVGGVSAGAGAGRAEQERPLQVGREGDQQGQQGMQVRGGTGRGTAQGGQAGTGLSRQQPSLLPAFFAHPGLMASAFMSNPFEFAQRMSEEMDRVFDNFGFGPTGGQLGLTGQSGAGRGLTGGQFGGRQTSAWTPPVELFQRGNELVVRADLPGLRPEDVNVDVENGVLSISGERRQEAEDRGEGFYRTERSYGSFYRSLPLPEGVSEDDINAEFHNGVLEVTVALPQREQPRSRRIQVRPGAGQSGRAEAAGSGSSVGGSISAGAGATEGIGTAGSSSRAGGATRER